MSNQKKLSLGEKLRFIRGEQSQGYMAAQLNISRPTYARYENGDNQPDAAFIIELHKKFGVSPNWYLLDIGSIHLNIDGGDIISDKNLDYNILASRRIAESSSKSAEQIKEIADELLRKIKEALNNSNSNGS